jgi:hypothetical protein
MLNKFFTNLLVLGLALNSVIYLFGVYNVDPQVHFPFTAINTWTDWFDISVWGILLTGGTMAAIGLAAVLLRQGTYAIYAMLLVGLTMIIKPIQDFVLAIPKAIATWLPNSTNPLPPDANGVYPPNPIFIVISLFFVFAAYWFIFGLVIQRDIA